MPPPVAMKRNPETGEMEEFHSHKLQDDLPEEEVRNFKINWSTKFRRRWEFLHERGCGGVFAG